MINGVESLLVTGVYGSGKSSVVEELGSMFEDRGIPYAALDLDWSGWFDAGRQMDLEWVEKWLAAGTGEGFEDSAVANDRRLRGALTVGG